MRHSNFSPIAAASAMTLALSLASCKLGSSSAVNAGGKMKTLDDSKVEFQYYGGTVGGQSLSNPGEPSGGLSPDQIENGKRQMISSVLAAFETALSGLKNYQLGFNSKVFDIEIQRIKMVETERLAFAANGSIVAGKGQPASGTDISTALFNAGFRITGLMSRYTMMVQAELTQSGDAVSALQLEPGETFDFWQNTLSVDASTKFDGSTILGAFLKTNPAVLSKFLPILNSLAEAKGGARLDTLQVSLAQSKKYVYPVGWGKDKAIPYSAYLVAKRIYEKICLAHTGNNTSQCMVPELQRTSGGSFVRSTKVASQASLQNYAVSPAMACKKNGSDFDVFLALPVDGTQDIGFQNGQKIWLYKALQNRWTKTGEYGIANIQRVESNNCPNINGETEKCIRIKQSAGFMSKFGTLCNDIKVSGKRATFGYTSLSNLTDGADEVKDRL